MACVFFFACFRGVRKTSIIDIQLFFDRNLFQTGEKFVKIEKLQI